MKRSTHAVLAASVSIVIVVAVSPQLFAQGVAPAPLVPGDGSVLTVGPAETPAGATVDDALAARDRGDHAGAVAALEQLPASQQSPAVLATLAEELVAVMQPGRALQIANRCLALTDVEAASGSGDAVARARCETAARAARPHLGLLVVHVDRGRHPEASVRVGDQLLAPQAYDRALYVTAGDVSVSCEIGDRVVRHLAHIRPDAPTTLGACESPTGFGDSSWPDPLATPAVPVRYRYTYVPEGRPLAIAGFTTLGLAYVAALAGSVVDGISHPGSAEYVVWWIPGFVSVLGIVDLANASNTLTSDRYAAGIVATSLGLLQIAGLVTGIVGAKAGRTVATPIDEPHAARERPRAMPAWAIYPTAMGTTSASGAGFSLVVGM